MDVELYNSRNHDNTVAHHESRCHRNVMLIKDRHRLCEDIKYIISSPDLCDVTFLVGPERLPVHGIKAIMATRSRVLHQLLIAAQNNRRQSHSQNKPKPKSSVKKVVNKIKSFLELDHKGVPLYRPDEFFTDNITVEIHNYDAHVFERFMRYVHCGSVSVHPSNVIGLMNAGDQFDFPELKATCKEFALRCIHPDTLPVLLDSAKDYMNFPATQRLIQKIWLQIRNMPDVLEHAPELFDSVPENQAILEFLL